MTSEQAAGLTIILAFYGALLLVAVKIFGLRRVLWFFVQLTLFGIRIAMRSLAVITGSRRY